MFCGRVCMCRDMNMSAQSTITHSCDLMRARFYPVHVEYILVILLQIAPFITFLIPNRPKTTWSEQRHDVCSGLVLLTKGSNGCKSRPVFSLFPFSSRLPPGHCLNAGDFGPNRHFGPFLTPNRPRTTWSVQTHHMCSGLVWLNKGSTRFAHTHTQTGSGFAQIVAFVTFGAPKSAWSHVARTDTR